jgi:hypothetical protein
MKKTMISIAVTSLLSMPVMAQEEGSESWTLTVPTSVQLQQKRFAC